VGSLILGVIGLKYIISKGPVKKAHDQRSRKFFKGFWSIFMLTLVNPMTIMFFLAVFSSLGLTGAPENHFYTLVFICGVFAGSTMWWLILSSGTNMIGRQIKPTTITLINRISGMMLIGFGIIGLLKH
jgi:threonine/homoserine/homoserine lactone efflux protein